MFKKGLLVLLALFMLVFLFAGCTSKNGGDTSLEGTWRVTEQCWVDEEDGEIVDEGSETYPAEDEEEDCLIQPYFQLKNNVFKSFSKHIYEEGSIVFLFGEGTYEVEGNTFTVTFEFEEEEDISEYTYVISGNKISISSEDVDEYGKYSATMKAVKVSDSEVAGAIPWDFFEFEE